MTGSVAVPFDLTSRSRISEIDGLVSKTPLREELPVVEFD